MARKIYILSIAMIALFFISGCVAKSIDVEKNSKLIAQTADGLSKLTDVVNSYHKNDVTNKLKDDMKAVAKEAFEESLKDKGLTVSEDLTKGVKAVGSITEMCGVPYGGVATDILIGLLGLFGGKKALDSRNKTIANKKKEDEDWIKYLASLTPEEAKKAIELNGV